MFYNLFDRVGSEDQLSLNLPGLVNKTTPTQTRGRGAGLLPAAGIPGRVPQRAEPRSGGGAAEGGPPALGRSERSEHDDAAGEHRPSARAARPAWCCPPISSTPATSNLATLINLNQPLPNAAGNNALGALPYPNFGFIEWRSDNGRAEYKGARPRPREALRRAATPSASPIRSASPRTTRRSSSRRRVRTRFRRTRATSTPWYGPSDYDVRHRFSANFVWALPLGTNAIARDWTLSGIYTAHTGHPFTVTQSGNNVGTNMTGLPNVTGDTDGPKTVDQWFNTAAFSAVPSGTFGNEQRNQLYGPGFQNMDLTRPAPDQARHSVSRRRCAGTSSTCSTP